MEQAVTASEPVRAFLAQLSKPRIVCDIDGTLAQRDYCALVAINAKFDTTYRLSDMTTTKEDWITDPEARDWYKKHRHDDIFLVDLPAYGEARWALWSLRSAAYHVTIASDRDASLLGISRTWLEEHRVDYDDLRVGDGEKIALARAASPEQPVAFFDDNPDRAADLPGPGATLYLLDRPWNQKVAEREGVIRVQTWQEVLAHFPVVSMAPPLRLGQPSSPKPTDPNLPSWFSDMLARPSGPANSKAERKLAKELAQPVSAEQVHNELRALGKQAVASARLRYPMKRRS